MMNDSALSPNVVDCSADSAETETVIGTERTGYLIETSNYKSAYY